VSLAYGQVTFERLVNSGSERRADFRHYADHRYTAPNQINSRNGTSLVAKMSLPNQRAG